MLKKIKRKNKKAVSIMIGYVLLISAAIFIGVIVYAWLKTYVPKATPECPDTTSIFIRDYLYDGEELQITLKNNGKFNLTGYFIRATDSPEQGLATIDLSSKLLEGGTKVGNSILFEVGNENTLGPNSETIQKFNLSETGFIYSIEIIPMRYQEQDNKIRLVSCGNAKIREMVTIKEEGCVPICTRLECGPALNNCGDADVCGTCGEGYDCADNQLCIDNNCIPADDLVTCLGKECGTFFNNCGNEVTCGNCTESYGKDYTCNLGTCVFECTDTCLTLGLECEFHEICGAQVNCEEVVGCDEGYKCVGDSCVEIDYLVGGYIDNVWPPGSGLYFDDHSLPQEDGKYWGKVVAFPEVDDTQCFLISAYSYNEDVYPYSVIVHLLLLDSLEIASDNEYQIWDESTDCCNSLPNCV